MDEEYKWITDEMFDAKLLEILEKIPMITIMRVAGVYEALSEEYNNEVLEALSKEKKKGQE